MQSQFDFVVGGDEGQRSRDDDLSFTLTFLWMALWKWMDERIYGRFWQWQFWQFCMFVWCVFVVWVNTYKLTLGEALSEEDTCRPHYVMQHVAVLNQSAQGFIKLTLVPSFLLILCVHLPCITQSPQHGSSQRGTTLFYGWHYLTGEEPIGLWNT